MQYVSIDIETTGLDTDEDQILQIAAVADSTDQFTRPVDDLPFVDLRLAWDRVWGSPFAMQMNAGLLLQIAKRDGTIHPQQAMNRLIEWMKLFATDASGRAVCAGKNFAGFDRQFLRRLDPNFGAIVHHRSIDPAMFYLRLDDNVPPSTEECLKRAGLDRDVKHDALDDARNVVRLIRASGRFGPAMI